MRPSRNAILLMNQANYGIHPLFDAREDAYRERERWETTGKDKV